MEKTIDNVSYRCYPTKNKTKQQKSIEPIGLDTEAYITGECFMICTSRGDVFTPDQFPGCFFTREYRGKTFVVYNLKYDSGAFVQSIPPGTLEILRSKGKCEYNGFTYTVIGNKCFTIKRGKNAIHIYDMYNFYNMSLNRASEVYLNEKKQDIHTVRFWPFYVLLNWNTISSYCIKDAVLTESLSKLLIKRFEKYGVYPKKLYSVAYISYQYFKKHCNYVTVKRYWQDHKELLRYAMEAYNGGKFEVTTKGHDYYYEYDIVSAYPYEISNLVNIEWARVVEDKKYLRNAVYGFIRCKMKIPFNVSSPVVMKKGGVNCYPVGEFERTITKAEYDYLIEQGADITIINAYWIMVNNKQYPYRREINKLVSMKQKVKETGDKMDYHLIKIFLNSLYGKFVQLIDKGDHYNASTCWNPIYGAVVTANCRIRIANLQSLYSTVVAVHTDSIISTKALPEITGNGLGALQFECEGPGLVLGSGIYQIGDKVRFRGFPLRASLIDLIEQGKGRLSVKNTHAYTWREVVFRGWDTRFINRFAEVDREVNINFDQKRLWLDDWKNFREISKHKVDSIPLIYSDLLF